MSARRRGLAKAAILTALGVAVFTVPVETATATTPDPAPRYTVTAEGITLPDGQVFQAHGHVNWETSWARHGVHFDPNNGQPGGKYIGQSFLPFNLEPGECVTWTQVHGFDYHFDADEPNVDPICKPLTEPEPPVVVDPTPVPSETPSTPAPTDPPVVEPTPTDPPANPEPTPTEEPTWTPPTAEPSPTPSESAPVETPDAEPVPTSSAPASPQPPSGTSVLARTNSVPEPTGTPKPPIPTEPTPPTPSSTASSASPALAATGSDTAIGVVTAGAVLVLGLYLVARARSRR